MRQPDYTTGRWKAYKRSHKECTVEVSSAGLRSVVARLRDDELCPEHGGSIEANAQLIAGAAQFLADVKMRLERGDGPRAFVIEQAFDEWLKQQG